MTIGGVIDTGLHGCALLSSSYPVTVSVFHGWIARATSFFLTSLSLGIVVQGVCSSGRVCLFVGSLSLVFLFVPILSWRRCRLSSMGQACSCRLLGILVHGALGDVVGIGCVSMMLWWNGDDQRSSPLSTFG